MERDASNGSSRSSRERNLQDEGGALAMSEEETKQRGFTLERQGERKEKERSYVAEERRIKRSGERTRGPPREEGARDSIRRASLILESKRETTTRQET